LDRIEPLENIIGAAGRRLLEGVPGIHRLHSWPIFTILAAPRRLESLSMSESKPEKQIDYIEIPATDIPRTKAL